MTAAELISLLADLDPNTPVYIEVVKRDGDGDTKKIAHGTGDLEDAQIVTGFSQRGSFYTVTECDDWMTRYGRGSNPHNNGFYTAVQVSMRTYTPW
jgi:hypothetical protein